MHEVHCTIIVIVVMSTFGSINRKLKIVHTDTVSVSVTVGKEASLEHLVVRVVDTRDNMGRVHGKLFILSEKVVDVLVEDHATNWLQRDEVLRPNRRSVKYVKVKFVLVCRIECLDV